MHTIEKHPLIRHREVIVFPNISKHIIIGANEVQSFKAMEAANSTNKLFFLTLQKGAAEISGIDGIHRAGVVVQIRQYSQLPDKSVKILAAGLYIADATSVEEQDGCVYANVIRRADEDRNTAGDIVYRQVLDKRLNEYAKISGKISPDLLTNILQMGDINLLLYSISNSLSVHVGQLQSILEAQTLLERLELVAELMFTEMEIIRLDEKIAHRVKHQMRKTNKEYHLNEKLKAIQKEMGKDDDLKADLDEIEQKIKDLALPDAVRDKAERELRKIKIMPPMSAESTVVRNYLDWLVSLPWGIVTEDNLDMANAEMVLERDHYGLEKPKERILEYLAVRKLSKDIKGPIICFVGPPGVGKTSLARSIAESMGRKFIRVSMGGVRDEAEIRGHRKTYIGSMPGKIIQYMRKAGSENPVFLLDEIDKLGSDYRGDPAAALLEALDPEQNKHFVDHYIEVEFDLSKVFFITTANTVESISPALHDRMEIIKISGYTENEKYHIARKYLIPKQLKEHNLDEERVAIGDGTIYELVRYYTKEAGVRNLEREVASLIRKSARKLTKDAELKSVLINDKDVEGYLGNRVFRVRAVYDDNEIGVATGLAWTPYGGDLLQVEVALSEGSGQLTVTGQLGDVMQESAKTAFSVVKSRAKRFSVPAYRFKDYDLHLHVPEGAVPKDGPSAGVTMTSAIMSVMADATCNCRIAMTGEITLRGKVLPVGGVKEKVLAAHRAGLKEVILPKENEKDLTDIPEDVRKDIRFHFVRDIDELFDLNILNKSGVMSLGS